MGSIAKGPHGPLGARVVTFGSVPCWLLGFTVSCEPLVPPLGAVPEVSKEDPMFILLLPAAAAALAGYGVVRVIETVEHVFRHR
jgi:hypothetical protein